jgi:hypothetical protein
MAHMKTVRALLLLLLMVTAALKDTTAAASRALAVKHMESTAPVVAVSKIYRGHGGGVCSCGDRASCVECPPP